MGQERLYIMCCEVVVCFEGISGDWTVPRTLLFKNRYRIPSARLAGWDYRWAGIYHVTINTRGRVCWFGEVRQGKVVLSPAGEAAAAEWMTIPQDHPRVALDEWAIMPDHLHGLLVFHGPAPDEPEPLSKYLLAESLGVVVGRFKSEATKRIRLNLKQWAFGWQTRFYDTIVRDAAHLEKLRTYIRQNPLRWETKK